LTSGTAQELELVRQAVARHAQVHRLDRRRACRRAAAPLGREERRESPLVVHTHAEREAVAEEDDAPAARARFRRLGSAITSRVDADAVAAPGLLREQVLVGPEVAEARRVERQLRLRGRRSEDARHTSSKIRRTSVETTASARLRRRSRLAVLPRASSISATAARA
jgi:hypothetical protein